MGISPVDGREGVEEPKNANDRTISFIHLATTHPPISPRILMDSGSL